MACEGWTPDIPRCHIKQRASSSASCDMDEGYIPICRKAPLPGDPSNTTLQGTVWRTLGSPWFRLVCLLSEYHLTISTGGRHPLPLTLISTPFLKFVDIPGAFWLVEEKFLLRINSFEKRSDYISGLMG